jgi:hypothetical protein
LVGVAVNVTVVPVQIVVADAVIETLAATPEADTVIATPFEVAGEPVKQGVALDVITQVTIFPFAKDAFVYVAEFDPTFAPFNNH